MKDLLTEKDAPEPNGPTSTEGLRLPNMADRLRAALNACGDGTLNFSGIETGFKQLDEVSDGLQGLVLIGATPGVGKSAFAIQVGLEQAKQGRPVVYLSYEMPVKVVIWRMLANLSGLNMADIRRNGRLYEDPKHEAHKPKFTEAIETLTSAFENFTILTGEDLKGEQDGQVFPLPPSALKPQILPAKSKADGKQPLFIVDSLNVVRLPGQHRDNVSRIEAIIADLRELTGEDATVIALSHINREGAKGGDPVLQGYKGSSGIEHEADLAIIMKNQDNGTDQEDGPERPIEFHVLKNRNGLTPSEPIKFSFNGATQTFTEEPKKGH